MKIEGTISVQEVLNLIPKETTCYFATSQDGQPGVRMMGLNKKEGTLWILTYADRRKVEELKGNSRMAVCIPLQGDQRIGQVQAKGRATLITDPRIKVRIAALVSWFPNYFKGPEDPEYILYRLDVNQYRVQHPEDGKYYLWEQVRQ